MRMPRGRGRAIWLAVVLGGAAASCGSRTGLFGEESGSGSTSSGGPAGEGGADGGRDTGADVPLIDATPRPDVDRTDCPDADATYVYVVTVQNELFSFYPPDLSFKFIGNLVCPSASGATPFSMAVDRRGVAYVLYSDGQLYRVSTATAACVKTTFASGQDGFDTFGMGFASDFGGAAEKLYVTDNDIGSSPLRGLGAIDTDTFKLSFIGSFGTQMRRSELTGTGDGRLFAFWPDLNGIGGASHLSELSKATGQIIAQTNLPIGQANDAFAFAFWGGDFWIFTSSGGPSDVNRYRPVDNATTTPTTHPSTIVGAGVSTCAPQL
ncbi:MAG TPA: hypothetical protein VLT33_15620 [Labilithrix sp.]|nr:hypothetical protein [Labilithrix sp.]